jgi:membrane-bound ClpP family serine protease
MESIYIIALWLLGIVLVVVGWYVSGAGGFAWLGAGTMIFGAVMAFRRSSSSQPYWEIHSAAKITSLSDALDHAPDLRADVLNR